MASELIYIGTMHQDPRGKKLLEKLLNHITPDIITVEASDERIDYMNSAKEELNLYLKQRGLNPELTDKYASLCIFPVFEWFVSEEYAQKRGIPIHKVGIRTEESRAMDKHTIESLKNPCLTDELLKETIEGYETQIQNPEWLKLFDEIYTTDCLKEMSKLPGTEAYAGERDIHMAKRISEIVEQNPNSKTVFVGGGIHMIDTENPDLPTVYTLLPPNKVWFLPKANEL